MPWAVLPGGGAAPIISAAIVFVRAISLFLALIGGMAPLFAAAMIVAFARERRFGRNRNADIAITANANHD